MRRLSALEDLIASGQLVKQVGNGGPSGTHVMSEEERQQLDMLNRQNEKFQKKIQKMNKKMM